MRKLNYTVQNSVSSKEAPLVLLHGFLESSKMWKQVEFPKGYPIVMIDLPGHGKSNHPELIGDSIEGMATAIIDVLDELKITKFHIIGHSMGGYLGLEIKKTDPRTEKVMLLNSNFWSDSPKKVKDRIRVAEIVRTNQSHFIYEVIPNLFLNPHLFDKEVKALISEALEMSSEAISQASIAMSKRMDCTDFVKKHASDFTCIQGMEDTIVSAKQMRKSVSEVNVNYIELENVGHMAHFEAPEKLNSLIDAFLK